MTADARDRLQPPKGPRLGMMIAVALELSITVTFASLKSWFGLLLCVAYLWFSATGCALFEKR